VVGGEGGAVVTDGGLDIGGGDGRRGGEGEEKEYMRHKFAAKTAYAYTLESGKRLQEGTKEEAKILSRESSSPSFSSCSLMPSS